MLPASLTLLLLLHHPVPRKHGTSARVAMHPAKTSPSPPRVNCCSIYPGYEGPVPGSPNGWPGPRKAGSRAPSVASTAPTDAAHAGRGGGDGAEGYRTCPASFPLVLVPFLRCCRGFFLARLLSFVPGMCVR